MKRLGQHGVTDRRWRQGSCSFLIAPLTVPPESGLVATSLVFLESV